MFGQLPVGNISSSNSRNECKGNMEAECGSREKPSCSSASCGIPVGPLDVYSRRTKEPSLPRGKYHGYISITKCKELQDYGPNYSDHCEGCQAPSTFLAPLYFFQVYTPSTPAGRAPNGRALLEDTQPLGPTDASISPSWAFQHLQ